MDIQKNNLDYWGDYPTYAIIWDGDNRHSPVLPDGSIYHATFVDIDTIYEPLVNPALVGRE
jgi:hypothetical protein